MYQDKNTVEFKANNIRFLSDGWSNATPNDEGNGRGTLGSRFAHQINTLPFHRAEKYREQVVLARGFAAPLDIRKCRAALLLYYLQDISSQSKAQNCDGSSLSTPVSVGILDNIHRLKPSYIPFYHGHSFPKIISLLIAVAMPHSSGSEEVEVHNDKHIPVSIPVGFLLSIY